MFIFPMVLNCSRAVGRPSRTILDFTRNAGQLIQLFTLVGLLLDGRDGDTVDSDFLSLCGLLDLGLGG